MRTKITLACTECQRRNYNMTKDKKTHPDRMETKKYSRFCRTHTGLKAEFQKIIWPEKQSVIRQTIAVLAVSVVTGLIIALLDWGIQQGVDFLIGLHF